MENYTVEFELAIFEAFKAAGGACACADLLRGASQNVARELAAGASLPVGALWDPVCRAPVSTHEAVRLGVVDALHAMQKRGEVYRAGGGRLAMEAASPCAVDAELRAAGDYF